LDSNRWSRLDLREDPQLKERNPQLIPKISQVVGPLQGYIRRPPHGERGIDIDNYIKLMIS
jgi:hypothetical protein